ncbi:MAG: DoxX family protein [Hyphomicrobiales bacterium]
MQFPLSIGRTHPEGQATARQTTGSTRRTKTLWAIQGALALVFLFAGASKLVMPADQLTDGTDLPVLFMRFIGCAETLGAVGLVLPGIVGVQRRLTPLAAAGLVIIMLGATVVTIATMSAGAAVFPFAVGVLAFVIAWGRRTELVRS